MANSITSKRTYNTSPRKPRSSSPGKNSNPSHSNLVSQLANITIAPPPTARLHMSSHSDISRQPPPSVELPDQYSNPSLLEDTPTLHRRTRTEASLGRTLPPLLGHKKSHSLTANTVSDSEEEEDDDDDAPIFTGSRNSRAKLEQRTDSIADWFRGSSDPVSLAFVGSPSQDNLDQASSRSRETSPTKSAYPNLSLPASLRNMNKPTRSSLNISSNASGFFSFLGSKSPSEVRTPPLSDDQMSTLDFTAALFPGGRPEDPYSPAAFKNLEMNARGILSKVFDAYVERTVTMKKVKADYEASQDAADELETRVQMLKAQVDELSRDLQREKRTLAAERQMRQEDEETRKRSIKEARTSYAQPDQSCLSAPRDRTSRLSMATMDSGFESGEDTSIYSGSSSATRRASCDRSVSSSSSSFSSDAPSEAVTPIAATTPTTVNKLAPKPVQQLSGTSFPPASIYQKMKNMVATTAPSHLDPNSPEAMTNEILQLENKMLKEKIVALEKTVDDCWDTVVAGLAGIDERPATAIAMND